MFLKCRSVFHNLRILALLIPEVFSKPFASPTSDSTTHILCPQHSMFLTSRRNLKQPELLILQPKRVLIQEHSNLPPRRNTCTQQNTSKNSLGSCRSLHTSPGRCRKPRASSARGSPGWWSQASASAGSRVRSLQLQVSGRWF